MLVSSTEGWGRGEEIGRVIELREEVRVWWIYKKQLALLIMHNATEGLTVKRWSLKAFAQDRRKVFFDEEEDVTVGIREAEV